ncbi:MAG: type II toxin-antitoxin system VapC family toxin [Gemmatimonadota bacterium]
MIFVDTSVFVYAVGRPHPLRDPARKFFRETLESGDVLVTSTAVLRELLHTCRSVGREDRFDAGVELARGRTADIWPIEVEDVEFARALADRHRGLGARALLHLACCTRREAESIKTFDRGLAALATASST